jgi:predicted nucleotidyltransferase
METQRMLKDKREEVLGIVAKHGARNAKVFGSSARGKAGPDSDLDLLIKLDPGRSLLDLIAIKQDLEDLLGCEVDVVTEAAISPYIREQVLKEAVSL